jgi:hypothetical protein
MLKFPYTLKNPKVSKLVAMVFILENMLVFIVDFEQAKPVKSLAKAPKS